MVARPPQCLLHPLKCSYPKFKVTRPLTQRALPRVEKVPLCKSARGSHRSWALYLRLRPEKVTESTDTSGSGGRRSLWLSPLHHRPRGIPLASVADVQKNFPNTVPAEIIPPRAHKAAFVCGTPLPRASGKNRYKRYPTDSEPTPAISGKRS